MGKKHEYHRARQPVLAESFEHIPSLAERVAPFGTEHDYIVDETLADRCIQILLCALADPHAPKGCAKCTMVCFAIISLGPNALSNAQIVRYNYHDFLDICMRFLTSPRTPEQYDAVDNLLQTCTCLNDDSLLINDLLGTYYNHVPAQRLEARKLASAALQRSKGKRGKKKTSTRGRSDQDMSDERELEYEEAYLRGEIGNFLDLLHEYPHLFEWRNSLGGVLCMVSGYISVAAQPFHDRGDLHKFKDTGKRRMWPARAEQLLPFGPRDTIAGLGYTAFRTLCWTSAGIAGVILDIVKGPTIIAVVDTYFPGAFVLIGVLALAELRVLFKGASDPGIDILKQSCKLLTLSSHLSLLAGTLLDISAPNLRRLNAHSLEQTGGALDIHHLCNAWVATLSLNLFSVFDNGPLGDIRKRSLHYFTRLCAALHHALGFASSEPPDPALGPDSPMYERRGDMQQASALRTRAGMAAFLPPSDIQKLDIVYEVQCVASVWVSTTESLVGAAFMLYYKLSGTRCWAPSAGTGTLCTMSNALTPNCFKRCAECWHVTYCSRECQKAAWRDEHKEICAVVRRVSDVLRVPRVLEPTESVAVRAWMEANAAQNWTSALITDLEKLASHFKPILDSVA